MKTKEPSNNPSKAPTKFPTMSPTKTPSKSPTKTPTVRPSTQHPTAIIPPHGQSNSPTARSGGPQTAVPSSMYKSLVCENYGSSCSAATNTNPPGTIDDCPDGSKVATQNDYEVREIKVQSGDLSGNGAGFDMREGSMVTITANIVTNTKAGQDTDYLDFFYTSDVSVDPAWQLIGTQLPQKIGGSQQLSVTYTLPHGGSSYKAVRVQLRYGGSSIPNNACDQGGAENGVWNDRDDLIFRVQKSNLVSALLSQ